MTTYIAHDEYSRDTLRLTISMSLDPLDSLRRLVVDGTAQNGKWIPTQYGHLYQHTDGKWGYPGLGFGPHAFAVRKFRDDKTTAVVGHVDVGDPKPTLGPTRIWPPDPLLPILWDAGFRTEDQLLFPFSIAAGESGFYTKVRNWLPSSGFRPSGTMLGVEGPPSAWNQTHTCQGHADRGLFQINSKFWGQYKDSECDDPAQACRTIYAMSKNGTEWTPWGFEQDQFHYQPFWDAPYKGFPALRPIVQAFLATKG